LLQVEMTMCYCNTNQRLVSVPQKEIVLNKETIFQFIFYNLIIIRPTFRISSSDFI
jgi:hypothetical protein